MDDKRKAQPNKIWPVPQIVALPDSPPAPTSADTLIPPDRLLRAEVTVYPEMDCDHGNEPLAAPTGGSLPPVVGADVLAQLGEPTLKATIKMVGAPHAQEYVPNFGPAWVGTAVRLAGVGSTVLFAPRRKCELPAEYMPDELSVDAFFTDKPNGAIRGGFGWGGLSIRAGAPFTVKLLEACPIVEAKGQEVVDVHARSLLARMVDQLDYSLRWHMRFRLVAQCSGGEYRREIGPVEITHMGFRPRDPKLNPAQWPRHSYYE